MCQNENPKCVICGKKITEALDTPGTGIPRLLRRTTCSRKCQWIFLSLKREREGYTNESIYNEDGTLREAFCVICGAPFLKTKVNRKKCDKHKNNNNAFKSKEGEEKECPICKKTFRAKPSDKKYCSLFCLAKSSLLKKTSEEWREKSVLYYKNNRDKKLNEAKERKKRNPEKIREQNRRHCATYRKKKKFGRPTSAAQD